MPNDMKKILERIQDYDDREMMPDDLSKMLDEELSKDSSEIDNELVNALIDELCEDVPLPQNKAEIWECIRRRSKRRRIYRRGFVGMRRAVAVAASFAVLFTICFTSAKAFNWSVLLKYLVPVAQTFGIVSTNRLTDDSEQSGKYWAESAPGAREIIFESLEDLPTELGRAIIDSGCIPPDFNFEQGIWYESSVIEKCNLFYIRGNDWINIEEILFNIDDDTILDYQFEKRSEVPDVFTVDSVEVTLYSNYDETSPNLSASWMIGQSNYSLSGTISKEELADVVHKLQSR